MLCGLAGFELYISGIIFWVGFCDLTLLVYSKVYTQKGILKSLMKVVSPVQLFATPWTVETMEFSRPEY